MEPTKPKEAGFGWRKGDQVGSDFGEENQEEVVGSKLGNQLPNFRGKPSKSLKFLTKFWSKSLSVFQAIGCKSISSSFILFMQWFD